MFKQHNTEPEFVKEHTRNGKVIKAHERSPKAFMQNKWIGVPLRIAKRDPEYIRYQEWRDAQGLN